MFEFSKPILIGPFVQIVTMNNLPTKGHIKDDQMEIIKDGAILVQGGKILQIFSQTQFLEKRTNLTSEIIFHEIQDPMVLIPGLIDTHTHICYAGNRVDEYAMKLMGATYQEIGKHGGGIMNTVRNTRKASQEKLTELTVKRARWALKNGITTCEVKSGYGLSVDSELKILRAIQDANTHSEMPELISTCLAAHVKPLEFENHSEYLDYMLKNLFPLIKSENLCRRADVFIEDGAFDPKLSLKYLKKLKNMGFSLTVHADQFSAGGAMVAAKIGAISADHLEATRDADLDLLKENNVIATVLPGASLGLGIPFAPAHKILDRGLSLVIASDWNPGSAPMGDLLIQAALLGAYEKLTISETLAGLTCRAALALGLSDRGILKEGFQADMVAFPCDNYREIFYRQGALKPTLIFRNGEEMVNL
ncbi:MAG: imidazolonepropionase [Promethearchaeota archaeon]